jgi:predicted metal-dependent phosphoesterase TrpH
MSIIQSSRGQDQLLVDGFRYRRANNSQLTWRCVRNNCAGRITSHDIEYIHLTDHNHAPNPDELLSKQFKSTIDERAETSDEPPRKIIHEALLDVYPGDAAAVQNYRTAQRAVYQSIHDLKTEQYAALIFAEKAESGIVKIVKRTLYEEIDERLQNLVANFNIYPRNEFFKRARALFNF